MLIIPLMTGVADRCCSRDLVADDQESTMVTTCARYSIPEMEVLELLEAQDRLEVPGRVGELV